jgi:hypothetical protein
MIVMKNLNAWLYVDSLELLGLCSNDTTNAGSDNYDAMIWDAGTLVAGQPGMDLLVNIYAHGWTVTTATQSNTALACNVLGGGALQSKIRVVIDGSDSNAGTCAWGIFQSNYHLVDSMIRYTTQGIGQWCHDTHDNIFEYIHNPYVPTHGNMYECNDDANGAALGQIANQPNVVYNNIFRHDVNMQGQPDLWLCPEGVPEYWFNNIMYDLNGEGWSIAGPAGYGCSNAGKQYMFNNTIADQTQPCSLNPLNNGTNGQYLTVLNEHLINAPQDILISPGCTGRTDPSNIVMSDATATSQGYTTGSAGTAQSNTCANDSSKPCTPTSSSNSTVGAGSSHQAYCTALATYSESAIGADAAKACAYGTTDGCSYNSTTHTMNCPAQTAVARPSTGAWDTGAYQFSGSGSLTPPQAPTSLTVTVN